MTVVADHVLLILLLLLVLVSGFFSGSETGMMSINRYRLRHLVRKKNRAAQRVSELLQRPDRLLGVILIGNTFANILASAIATMLAVKLFGELGVIVATVALTIVILIFAEIMPKTVAALYPERVAFRASLPLKLLLKLLYPFVWFVNTITNAILNLFGIKVKKNIGLEQLSREELRTVLHEASEKIPEDHQTMLLSILDLEKVTVEDVMIPRNEIIGIDLTDEWESILKQLSSSHQTRLILYKDNIDQVVGILHMRKVLGLLTQHRLTKTALIEAADEPYFIPEGTPLNVQLLNFQQTRERIGLVVDEYGDILGLATLSDILEEIVGEFDTELVSVQQKIEQQKDGSYLIEGSLTIRDINRYTGLSLPTAGPKTLSGLITEELETLPMTAVAVKIENYPIEVVKVKANTVKLARIWPALKPDEER